MRKKSSGKRLRVNKQFDMRRARFSLKRWSQQLFESARKDGKSDEEITEWVKAYANRRGYDPAPICRALRASGVYRYRIDKRTVKRGFTPRHGLPKNFDYLNPSPKLIRLSNEVDREIGKWQLAVLKTLEIAEDEELNMSDVKQSIRAHIEANSFPARFRLEIARLFPELKEAA